MSSARKSPQDRTDSLTTGLEEHSVPLLSQEERHSNAGHDQMPTVLPRSTAPEAAAAAQGLPAATQVAVAPAIHSEPLQLHIEASIAQYPFVTGQPIRYPAEGPDGQGSLVFVPDLPNTQQLWQAQKTLMVAWLATSIMSLVLFAPFYITTGLFLGAEISAILGIVASATHLSRRHAADGVGLSSQIRLAVTCGMAAFCLDFLTAVLDLLIGWGIDCEGDDACTSMVNYVVVFGLYLSWHAYLSLQVHTRCKDILPMLNPVTSGIVQL